MNYIHSLQATVAEKNREVQALRDGLADLYSYVTSAKYATDTNVNAADIVLRIREVQALADAAIDVPTPDQRFAGECLACHHPYHVENAEEYCCDHTYRRNGRDVEVVYPNGARYNLTSHR